MGRNLPKSTTLALNCFEEVDPEIVNMLKSRKHKFINVGPFSLISSLSGTLHKDNDSRCLEWLDKHTPASVAYIAFGSMATPPPHELEAIAHALIQSRVPFVWSCKGNIDDLLPKGHTKSSLNGKIVSWAPQVQVLGHASIGVFVTHAGWNSVMESIACGVPMICRPFFGDHNLNMRTVVAMWQIGVEVEGGVITELGLMEALELILKHEQGREMRKKIEVLKGLASQAVECNGSSTKAFNSWSRY